MAFPVPLGAYSDLGFLSLRLAIGVVFVYHAILKLKDPKAMAKSMGMEKMAMLPGILGFFELVSGAALVFGAFVQHAAFILSIVMLGAIYFKMFRWKVPFAAYDKTGWEFDFVLLASSLFLLINGGGAIGLGL